MVENSESYQGPKKVALVTGSTSGIGSFIARDLAKSGQYTVIITGRDKKALDTMVSQCRNSVAFQVDLLSMKQVDSMINFVRAQYGRLDLLINNACWRGRTTSLLNDEPVNEIDEVMHVNLFAPMYLIHRCLIPLRPPDGDMSLVINISSGASQIVVPLHLYSISKACLSEMSRQVAALTDELGILSITVSPGPILTDERPHHVKMSELTLARRVGKPQEVSDLVMFVLGRAACFNGRQLFIDGGYIVKSTK